MDNHNQPALDDMRAALQACVEHAESDIDFDTTILSFARQGLTLLAALNRDPFYLTPRRCPAPVIRVVR